MQFYEVSDNTAFECNWTYASSIHARSHEIRWSCPDCGRAASCPVGAFDVTIEGGTDFPDILQCGAFPLLIVSERVLAKWKRHDFGPHGAYRVGVSAAIDTDLRPVEAPTYFRIEEEKVSGTEEEKVSGTEKRFGS